MFLGMNNTRLERKTLIILDFENGFLPTFLPQCYEGNWIPFIGRDCINQNCLLPLQYNNLGYESNWSKIRMAPFLPLNVATIAIKTKQTRLKVNSVQDREPILFKIFIKTFIILQTYSMLPRAILTKQFLGIMKMHTLQKLTNFYIFQCSDFWLLLYDGVKYFSVN